MIAALVAAVGGVLILLLSATFASETRAHQLSGQPLPNGHGGVMSIRGGYEGAIFLLVIGLVWVVMACRFLYVAFTARRPGPPSDKPDAA